MNATRLPPLVVATAVCAVLLVAQGRADETEQQARFAAPVRIKAGGALVGEGRCYPSPVMST